MCVCVCVSAIKRKFLNQNVLKLGTVVDVSKHYIDFGFKGSRVRGTGSTSLHIFGLSPNRLTIANIIHADDIF